MNNFNICNVDTDSITVCKPSGEVFSEEEIDKLTKELNSLYPDEINWEFESTFDKIIVLKAKNYILYDGKTISLKGSSLKSATLEPSLKEMLHDFINAFVYDKHSNEELVEIYNKYIRLVSSIKDIKPWCSKKTLSATTYASTRKNESNIIDAIKGTEYTEGDRVYTFFKSDGTLAIVENFDGDYNVDKFLEKVYKTALRFSTILPTDELFLNYKLKRNKLKLGELLGTSR